MELYSSNHPNVILLANPPQSFSYLAYFLPIMSTCRWYYFRGTLPQVARSSRARGDNYWDSALECNHWTHSSLIVIIDRLLRISPNYWKFH
jgi:hypothetical protein